MNYVKSLGKLLHFRQSDPWWYVLGVFILIVCLAVIPWSPLAMLPVGDGDYAVIRVIDGDTIEVMDNAGAELKVRLIGIDTPELAQAGKAAECFADEAKSQITLLLYGQIVELRSDPTQADRDRYDRLLRYVISKDGSNVNLEMIREGFAYEFTYDEPYLYQTEFKLAAQSAQALNLGLWRECIAK